MFPSLRPGDVRVKITLRRIKPATTNREDDEDEEEVEEETD